MNCVRKKRSFFSDLKCDIVSVNKCSVLTFSSILVFTGIFTRWVSGSPVWIIHSLGIGSIVPPTYIMALLSCLAYFLGGTALASVLGGGCFSDMAQRYRGAMWFCIMASLGYVWYPIFFCANLIFVSMIISALCIFCAVTATLCFSRVSRLAFVCMILYDVWLLALLLLNLRIFFTV